MAKTKLKIDPLAIALNRLFVEAITHQPPLTMTAFCIDLAKTAIGWELASDGNMATKAVVKQIKEHCFAGLQ